jgi:FKBP-type peptidyl-prolyl cis-trans isomerase
MLVSKKQKAKSEKQKAWGAHLKLSAFCFSLLRFNFLLSALRFALCAFCFLGCTGEFKRTDSGLGYKFIHRANGKAPQNGEYLILDLQIKTETDSILYNTADARILYPLRYDTYKLKIGQKSELEEGLFMMHEGDSAIFSVKAADVYAALNIFQPNPTNDRLYCYAKLVSVLDYNRYSNWKSVQLARRQNENALHVKKAMEEDARKIDSVLHARHESFAVTGSGIRYVIEKQGIGSSPHAGDSVFFRYDVTYLDGTTPPDGFGQSGDVPKSFMMGSKSIFESWQESIALLKEGGAGRFYIPSQLAFGASEIAGIKPNAILVVSIQLEDVKSETRRAKK